jgi:alginate O-acetyltransferase complex protein AlgI
MLFSSLIFIYGFLPAVILLYYAAPNVRLRNILLTLASLFFYSWGEPVWIIILLASSAASFICGILIDKNKDSDKASKIYLCISVFVGLGLLIAFKYLDFIVANLNLIGFSIAPPGLRLPIGISFYTFQALSYTIDVYKKKVKAQKSFIDFLLYISMFFQLIAGPIVRYEEVETQIRGRTHSPQKFADGASRFVLGLAKKTIIANRAGEVAGEFLGVASSGLGTWYGVFMYSIQIYFDFSGYSDMAIGLAKMFGFEYSENFNYPYVSKSVTEFWRRWHISLGTFFKDYVYIPLGGNRKFQLRNIFLVWFLTGFWHGANWNFIFWGLYYGVLLAAEKFLLKNPKIGPKIPTFVSRIYTLFFVALGWAIFYFTDLAKLALALKAMFGFTNAPVEALLTQSARNNFLFILIAVFAATPFAKKTIAVVSRNKIAEAALNVVLAVICTALLTRATYNPFLYFQF